MEVTVSLHQTFLQFHCHVNFLICDIDPPELANRAHPR